MTSIAYSSLSAMQSTGHFEGIDNETEFSKLCFEVKTIRRKMAVLPTARESEALPDLIYTSKLAEYLNNSVLPGLEKQLTENPKLQKLLFEDYLQGLCSDAIKARVYNNKEIVRVIDSIFSNLVSYCTSRLSTENVYLYSLLNTIMDKSVDYYTINGKESNIFEWAFGEPLKASEESQKWLKTLHKGDLVDCQKPHHFRKPWSRALFEGIESSLARVRFVGEINSSFINNPEFELAKVGSKSTDFQWRENLQVGDLVDYYHYRVDWTLYRVSRVVIEDNVLGEQVKYVELKKDTPALSESDEDIPSKKPGLTISMGFSGVGSNSDLSENLSQIFPVKVHSASLAPANSYSNRKETAIKDSDDVLLLEMVSQKKYGILRPGTGSGSNSIYFTKYVNIFGSKLGFDFLVDVASHKVQVKQDTMVHLIQMIQNFSESLVEPFVREHGVVLLDWLIKYIETNVEQRIRTITQINLVNFIDAVSVFTKRVWSQSESTRITNEVIISIGLICLRSEILEKQFFGAKKIIELEEKIRNDNTHGLRLKLADMLSNECIFDKVIRSHPNLIEKAFGIFKILFDENKISEEQLALLWDQICKADSESKSALIGMIKSISWHMSSKQTSFFLNKMILNSDEISTDLLEMISSLRKVAASKHKDTELVGLLNDLLWKLYQNDQESKRELSKELLQVIVKNVRMDSLHLYFAKAAQNLEAGKNITKNLKLIIKFLKEPGCVTPEVVELLKKHKVIEFCISKLYQVLNQNSDDQKNDLVVGIRTAEDSFEPQKSVKIEQLFKFFSSVVKSVSPHFEPSVFTFNHFSEIFEVVLNAKCVHKCAHDWLYAFLREEKHESQLATYQQFFLKHVHGLENDSGEEFFRFFLVVFLNVNEMMGSIRNKKIRLESHSNSYKFSSKTIFLTQKPFENLFGADQLWAIFLKTNNKKLYLQLGNFIANFNLQPEYAGADDLEFYQSHKQVFFDKAVQLFYSQEPFAANKACILLVRIIKNEELKKGSGIVSFGQLKESEKMALFVEKDNRYSRDKFKYNLNENLAVYQLKEHIAHDFKIPFEVIAVVRENTDDLNQIDNIMTLEAVGIHPCETLSVKERELPESDSEITNDDKNDFSPRIKMVFQEIFSDHSDNGCMNLEQMKSAITKMSPQGSGEVRIETFESHFRQLDKENKGFIHQSDFIDYFRLTSLCSERGLVLLKQSLGSLGYSRSFHLKKFPTESDPTRRVNFTRFKLASDDLFYRTLLKMISCKYESRCSQSNDIGLTDVTEGVEHCVKLFELLPPAQSGISLALTNPVQSLVECKSLFVFGYNATILNAILFKSGFIDSLKSANVQTSEITYSSFVSNILKQEWLGAMLSCLKNNIQLAASEIDLLSFLLAPLKLLEKILKAVVSTEDQNFLQSMKNITNYLAKKRRKTFEKISQNDDANKNDQKSGAPQSEDKDADDENLRFFTQTVEQLELTQAFKNSFPFSELNKTLIGLFDVLNSLKEDVNRSQRSILKSTIILFVSSVRIQEHELLALIDQDEFKSIIIKSLTSEKNIIRYFFKNLYSLLATETRDLRLKIKLFKVLISTLGSDRKDDFHVLVELACSILAEIAEMKNQSPENERYLHAELNFLELFGKFKKLLFSHESTELSSEDGEDNLLVSYLAFLEKILKADGLIGTEMSRPDKQELIAFIFKQCLFFLQSNDICLDKSKCKTKKSRMHAFELLKQLLKDDIRANIYFVATCLNPLSNLIPSFQVQNAMTSDPERRSKNGFVGIKNLGCVCYMIATLQQFYCTPVFRYGILMANDGKNSELAEFRGRTIDDNIFHQFQKMMSYLDKSERKDYCPQDFCFAYKDHSGQPTNVMIQQDADEFLKVILEKLENSLKNSPFIGILNSVYLGKICNVIKCKSCGYEKTNEENFYNISLEVKKMSNIMESFDKLIEEEIISDYMCDSCKKKCDISKRALLKKLPNVLILSLKKMCFDLELLANIKIHNRYEFPMNINLHKYMYQPQDKPVSEEIEQPLASNNKIKESECEYRLIGVVVHKGNAEFGHYTSLINANRGDPCRKEIGKDTWFEFDDSRVTPFDMRKFEEECFGLSEDNEYMSQMMSHETMVSKSAYLLVYDKIRKDPVVFPFNEENISQKDFIIANLNDPSDHQLQDNLLTTSFYNINQFLPEPYKAEILADNKLLILEQQLLSKTFTNGIAEIIQNTDLSFDSFSGSSDANLANKKILAEGLLNSLPKIITKVYSCAHENVRISNVVNAIERAMSFLSFCKRVKPELSVSIDLKIFHFFKEECFDKLGEIINTIISTNDVPLKNGLIDFIVKTLTVTIDNFQMESLSPADDDESDIQIQTTSYVYLSVQSLITTLTRIDGWTNSSRRLGIIFGIIKRLGEDSDAVLKQLAENGFLVFLKELYINTDASRLMGIERILASILGIIRIIYDYERKNVFENDLFASHVSQFSKSEIIIKAFKEDYKLDSYDELKAMIRTFCINDRKTTEVVTYYCLKNMFNRQESEMIGQLESVKALLSIADELSDYRIRIIFGVPRLSEVNIKKIQGTSVPLFGLGRDQSLKMSVNEYVSPFGLERGLLQWIWESKENFPKATMLMIFYVVELMLDYEDVLDYICKISPPNYLSATFYDWFYPFCETHLKSPSTVYSSFRSEFEVLYAGLIPEKLSSLKRLIADKVSRLNTEPNSFKISAIGETPYTTYSFYTLSQSDVESDLLIFSHNPIYLIGKTVNSRVVKKSVINIDEPGILKLKFRIANVSVGESLPTGTSNKFFPKSAISQNFQVLKSVLNINGEELGGFLEKFTPANATNSSEDEISISLDEEADDQSLKKATPTTEITSKYQQTDFVFSILCKSTIDEAYLLRLRIEKKDSTGFAVEEVLSLIPSMKSEATIYSITLPTLNDNFSILNVFASFKVVGSLSLKNYTDEGFSEWTTVFDAAKDLGKEEDPKN